MFLKNIVSSFALQIVIVLYGFVTSIIVARFFGPEGQGYIAYIFLLITLISNYAHLGISDVTPYFSRKLKEHKLEDVFNTNMSFLILISFLIASTIIILRFNDILLVDYSWSIILLALIMIFSNLITLIINGFYIGFEYIHKYNYYTFISNTIRFLSLILLLIIGKLSITSYMAIFCFSSIIQLLFVLKNIKIKFKLKINKDLLFNELKMGFLVFLGALFIYLNYRADQLLINHFLGKKLLGIYSIAVSLSELAFTIPQSVAGALMGRLVNRKENQQETIIKTVKYSFYITLLVVGIGLILSPTITIIYGSNYVESIDILQILFIGIVFATIGKVVAPIAVADGKPAIHLCISLAAFIINIVLNYLLIPIYGLKGAAIASTISYIIYGLLYALFLLIFKKISINDIFILRKNDLINIMSIFRRFKKNNYS